MAIDEFLRRPTWVCQWRCPFMGEVNRTRNQDLPPGIKSIDDLLAHLICHSCKMHLNEIPLIHIVVYAMCPAAIPQNKKCIRSRGGAAIYWLGSDTVAYNAGS